MLEKDNFQHSWNTAALRLEAALSTCLWYQVAKVNQIIAVFSRYQQIRLWDFAKTIFI